MAFNAGQCITCCYQCPKRHPGCHGSCETYKQQRAEYDAKKAEKQKQADVRYSLNSFYYDSVHKNTKRNHSRSKNRKGRWQ